jgi:hypothetical protein
MIDGRQHTHEIEAQIAEALDLSQLADMKSWVPLIPLERAGLARLRGDAPPCRFADEISLVGPIERIRDRLRAWNEPPVTMIVVMSHDLSLMRTAAEVVLG